MSRRPPNKAEAARIGRMLRLGCIACMESMGQWQQPECHHIVISGRRLGHAFTLPICPGHHRGAWTDGQVAHYAERRLEMPPTINGGIPQFERRFGTQQELYMRTQSRLCLPYSWPSTKILPRRVA